MHKNQKMTVTRTFGGDHQLTGQSQRGHGVLVNQSGETTYEQKHDSLSNWIILSSKKKLIDEDEQI